MKPWIIAHRGASFEAPENTRSAFDKALTYPIEGLELDVQMTGDGRPVLYHHRTLAQINGSRKRISDYTYKQLLACDWGGWYSPKYAGEKILTLQETLSLYSRSTRLLIEIKSRKQDRMSGRSFELTDNILKAVETTAFRNRRDNIFILSFDPDVLKYAFRQAPGLKYVLNLSRSSEELTSPAAIMRQPRPETDHLYALCVQEKFLSQELVSYTHKLQKLLMTYSCNVTKQVNKALNLNVNVIITDKPGWLAALLHKKGLR